MYAMYIIVVLISNNEFRFNTATMNRMSLILDQNHSKLSILITLNRLDRMSRKWAPQGDRETFSVQ